MKPNELKVRPKFQRFYAAILTNPNDATSFRDAIAPVCSARIKFFQSLPQIQAINGLVPEERRSGGLHCQSHRQMGGELSILSLAELFRVIRPYESHQLTSYLRPRTTVSGPARCSTRVWPKPISVTQLQQSAPV